MLIETENNESEVTAENETPPEPTPANKKTPAKETASKWEKALADDVAAIKKHLGLDKPASVPANITTPPEPDEPEETDIEHDDDCPCAYCYMAREESD